MTDVFENWVDLAHEAEEEPDFMIDGLIHAKTNIISGKPTTGKTRLAAGIAAAVARGDEKFCGQAVTREGRVLVLTTDAGEANRWGLRMDELGVSRAAHDVVRIGRFRSEYWALYAEEAAGASLLILDNVNGALSGNQSINDDGPARSLCQPLTDIADAGTTVILLTHSAKNSEARSGRYTPTGAMGSTVYEAFSRCTIHIHDVNELFVRNLEITSNDYGLRNLTLEAEWTRSAAHWSLLDDKGDSRPRTDNVYAARRDLFDEVAGHPQWSQMKNKSAIGRALFAAHPGQWASDDAARQAFDSAVRARRGKYADGRWSSGPTN